MGIKIKNLYFSYDKKNILKDINLDIKRGQLTGILGPNGCGKSTLLKNILGHLSPDSGEVIINDINIKNISQKELAKILGSVPQKSSLNSALSVIDFVLLGRLPHLTSTWLGYSKNDKKIARNKIEQLNLKEFENRIALSLSGGEFQRVLLARALTQEPQTLLLDEPTSALDLNHAIELLSEVKKLIKTQNLTGIVVLHDLNLASLFCDELVVMKKGKIISQGTPEDIITENLIFKVYDLKTKIIKNKNKKPYVIPIIEEEL